MTHVTWRRDDCVIRITARESDIDVTLSAGAWQERFTTYAYQPWKAVDAALMGTDLQSYVPEVLLTRMWNFLVRWTAGFLPRWLGEERPLPRIVLDVDDAEWAALPWEELIGGWLPPVPWKARPIIVRTSVVHAPVCDRHVTLPLNIRQVSWPGAPDLSDAALAVFGSHNRDRVARAVLVERSYFGDSDNLLPGSAESFADVLHLDWPDLEIDLDALLSTRESAPLATLGGLSRLAALLETRLVVITCQYPTQTILARHLGAAIVERGGPAVMVVPLWQAHSHFGLIQQIYENLIHNFPMDAALQQTSSYPQTVALFAGAGREESLRVSRMNEEIQRAATALLLGGEPSRDAMRRMYAVIGSRAPQYFSKSPVDVELARSKLQRISTGLSTLTFEDRERDGLLPMADSVQELEALLPVLDPSVPAQPQQQQQQQQGAPAAPSRYVNLTLWEGTQAPLRALRQLDSRLYIGAIYHLCVEITLDRLRTITIGETPIPEQVFDFERQPSGVWIEIAVTGLDFEVIGDAVRQLLLPRSGSTRRIYFAVTPTKAPVARLRVTLYHKQNVVQSLRLVATTKQSAAEPEYPEDVRRLWMADALGGEVHESYLNLGFVARLEYSTTAVNGFAEVSSRALSLVANDHNGEAVITVKGEDEFDVTRADVSKQISDVRNALRDVANEAAAGNPTDFHYRFGLQGIQNQGSPEMLEQALLSLAREGRNLYVTLFPSARAQLKISGLLKVAGTIHVAHILAEKVIPWAALYDKHYDSNDTSSTPTACLGVLKLPEKERAGLECGTHPTCVLHGAQGKESTVVCPLHFWGLRHLIEIPPRQVDDPKDAQRKYPQTIRNTVPVRVTAALHQKLDLWETHLEELELVFGGPRAEFSHAFERPLVLSGIDDTSVDIVYFYCHAGGDSSNGYLEFQASTDLEPQKIASGDLRALVWSKNPMVFINGCRTAGFSASALSPFVRAFIGREAAGVVGTEIDIWEPLACEFAKLFLGEFLKGVPAGEAMRTARFALLEKYNPLGLAYTLYAPSNLRLSS